MKKRKIFLLYMLLAIGISACKNKDEVNISEGEYLIFGRFYGECLEDACVKTYKIMHGKLYADRIADYNHKEFAFELINADPSSEVLDLQRNFPVELFEEKDTVLGCPDCADQGGIYIETNFGGIKQFWRIDQSDDKLADYLLPYKAQVNKILNDLN